MIRLETPRLRLREHRAEDAPALGAILSDPAATYYIPSMHMSEDGEVARYLAASMADADARPRLRYNLAIADGCDRLLGEIGLHHIDGAPESGHWGLGYFIRPDLWNLGYATEAARAAVDFIFARGAFRVSASCLAENLGSRRVLEKCGFTQEALLLRHTWHDGAWKDCAVYRAFRPEPIERPLEATIVKGKPCLNSGKT